MPVPFLGLQTSSPIIILVTFFSNPKKLSVIKVLSCYDNRAAQSFQIKVLGAIFYIFLLFVFKYNFSTFYLIWNY